MNEEAIADIRVAEKLQGRGVEPCPFCGNKVGRGTFDFRITRDVTVFFISCPCGAKMESWDIDALVDGWNRRA